MERRERAARRRGGVVLQKPTHEPLGGCFVHAWAVRHRAPLAARGGEGEERGIVRDPTLRLRVSDGDSSEERV